MGRVMHRDWRGIQTYKGRSLCTCIPDQRSSQRSTKSKRNGLTGEADEGGRRPRELGGERAGNIGAGVTSDEVKESLALITNGAEGGDNEGDTAEAAVRWRSRRGAEVVTR